MPPDRQRQDGVTSGSTSLPQSVELMVIGGGPAGLGAAIEAARHGVQTILVDENERAGGQLYKQIHKFFGSAEHHAGVRGFRIAENLITEAESMGVRILTGSRAIGVLRDGRIAVQSPERSHAVFASRVVLAAGGRENSLPFPGSTLPGIMSAGAAQTLCNVHRVLPGKRVAMIGSGNVGLIVAYQLMQAGAEIMGMIEVRNKIGGYYVHAGKLSRAHVPFFLKHRVVRAEGDGGIEKVTIESLSSGKRKQITVDGLYLSVGLTPRQELGKMFGCAMAGESLLGGLFPLHDRRMQTSVEKVYVAGDAAGIEEANSSLDEGRLAGVSVAEDIRKLPPREAGKKSETIRARLAELRSGKHGEARLRAKERVTSAAENKKSAAPVSYPNETNEEKSIIGSVTPDSIETLEAAKRLGHSLPILDCPDTIPCNPCVTVCPAEAISMNGICGLPEDDYERCTCCMHCVAACPGQAVFMIGPSPEAGTAHVTIPWEFLPPPGKGDTVELYGRDGGPIGRGTVSVSRMPRIYDSTRLVTLRVAEEVAISVQSCSAGEEEE